MQTDELQDSLDYARVFDLVQGLAHEKEYNLLEGFAGRIEAELRRALEFGGLVIRIKKLRPPLAGSLDYAGIEVRRP